MSENSSRTILVIGTFDTKNDELFYLSDCIQKHNGNVLTMDVSVLGDPEKECDISKHEVAKAANFTPFVFHAKKIKIRITIGKGIQLNNVSSPFKVASIGWANFLKSGRCVNSHSLIFLSIHSAIGM